jgi:hypothetical protein
MNDMNGVNISPPKTNWRGMEKYIRDFKTIIIFAAF